MDVTISSELIFEKVEKSSPKAWASAGRKFSTTTSALWSKTARMPLPVSVFRLRVTPRLLVFRYRKGMLFSGWGSSPAKGPIRRAASPSPGGSTFITSAP
jgi:hypothetical protein